MELYYCIEISASFRVEYFSGKDALEQGPFRMHALYEFFNNINIYFSVTGGMQILQVAIQENE